MQSLAKTMRSTDSAFAYQLNGDKRYPMPLSGSMSLWNLEGAVYSVTYCRSNINNFKKVSEQAR